MEYLLNDTEGVGTHLCAHAKFITTLLHRLQSQELMEDTGLVAQGPMDADQDAAMSPSGRKFHPGSVYILDSTQAPTARPIPYPAPETPQNTPELT